MVVLDTCTELLVLDGESFSGGENLGHTNLRIVDEIVAAGGKSVLQNKSQFG